MKEEMLKLLDTLEEKDRRIIQMRYFEGRTQAEAAQALDMAPAEVSRRERMLIAFIQKRMRG